MKTIYLEDPAATEAFAVLLAKSIREQAPASLQIALEGRLGAGKSHLARAVMRALGVGGAIPSPTYSLLESYPDAQPAAAHMDWYRLGDPMELEMLDWDGLCRETPIILVEWASKIPEVAREMDLEIELHAENAGRRLTMHPLSPVAKDLVAKIDPVLKEVHTGR